MTRLMTDTKESSNETSIVLSQKACTTRYNSEIRFRFGINAHALTSSFTLEGISDCSFELLPRLNRGLSLVVHFL